MGDRNDLEEEFLVDEATGDGFALFWEAMAEPEVWLRLRVLASWPSTSASCSLVLSLQQGLDHEQVEDVGLLAILLVIELVGASFQLGSLFTETILGPGTGETVWLDWIVLEEDLRDEWPLWWICLECCGAFGR